MSSLREVVADNLPYFSGTSKETPDSVDFVERNLCLSLPEELKWLLVTHGYGKCTIVPNLEETVSDTNRFRNHAGLPSQYLVLEDLNDAGVVILDTQSAEGAIVWLATHCLGELKQNKPQDLSDSDYYPNLASWAKFKLNEAKEEYAT